MKISFIHLSDIHCSAQCNPDSIIIEKAILALRETGEVDEYVILFTGDLSSSGQSSEYDIFERAISKFQIEIKNQFTKNVSMFIVPGNHDLDFRINNRGFNEIATFLKSSKSYLNTKFNDELLMLENFFAYSSKINCFDIEKIIEKRIINLCGVKIQVNLLNSAPFSTKENNSKELHYFPEIEMEKIKREEKIDLHVTLLHHSLECFEWNTKKMLETIILKNSDLLFYGHDHVSKIGSFDFGEKDNIKISRGGKINLNSNEDSKFNVLVYDTSLKSLDTYELEWINKNKEEIFFSKPLGKNVNILPKSNLLKPSREFVSELLKDENNITNSVLNYFVFPKLIERSNEIHINNEKIISDEIFFEELSHRGIINLSGSALSGKTTLLKYIYDMSIKNGYFPLFASSKNYKSSGKTDKYIKDMFEEQYSEDKTDWHRFKQLDKTKKIILIDDFDNTYDPNKLLQSLTDEVDLIVFSTQDNFECNLTEKVKNAIKKPRLSIFKISRFLKEKREELVGKICNLLNANSTEIDKINLEINYLAQHGAGIIVLSPEAIIQYVKFFMNSRNEIGKRHHIFNEIFETNITNSIINKVKNADVSTYITVLEEIAYSMYFELRKEVIELRELETIVSKYNEDHKGNVNCRLFYESICKTQIIKYETKNSFSISFTNKNIMAYFVARKLSRNLERNPEDICQIKYLVKNICFGINDIIILFLSYIRSNPRIISIFEKEARAILSEYEELDFDNNNVPFLKEYYKDDTMIPSQEDKKHYDERIEKEEEKKQENAVIRYKSIFDYNEEEANKSPYRISRAFKCLEVIGKSLVSQHSTLYRNEKENIVNIMFEMPNRLLYAILKPYSDKFEEIITELEIYVSYIQPEKKINKKDIVHFLSEAGLMLVLNVYDSIALYCTDSNTFENLIDYKVKNSNEIIQSLIMCENTRNSDVFIDKSAKICENTKDFFLEYLVKLIAQKHILTTPSLKRDHRNKLASNVFGKKSEKDLLILSQKAEKNK
jgi:predicted phosphodiesterase